MSAVKVDLLDWTFGVRLSSPRRIDDLLGPGLVLTIGPVTILAARISLANWNSRLSLDYVKGAVRHQKRADAARARRRRKGGSG